MVKLNRKLLAAFVVGGCSVVGYNVENRKYPQFKKQELRDVISQEPYSVQIFLHLPLNALSRAWGKASHVQVPRWSRPYLYGLYARSFNCNLAEAVNEDLKSYKTFGEFFRRAIKPEARPISQQTELVSPCDGTILFSGPVTEDNVEHVKAKTYNLKYFLGPIDPVGRSDASDASTSDHPDSSYCKQLKTKSESSRLYHCTIYLAPGDYHRFHSPTDWSCNLRRHFPGYLLSVNPWMVGRFPELMNVNERVVYAGSWGHGFFSMTAVGATNVGSIKIYKDPQLVTNQREKLPPMIDFDFTYKPDLSLPVRFDKGEAFGEFNLGSTIVLIFEAPEDFKFDVIPGEGIKFGEPLGS